MKVLDFIFFSLLIFFIFFSFYFFNKIHNKKNDSFFSEKVAISFGDEEDYFLREIYVKNKLKAIFLIIIVFLIIYILKLIFYR